MSANISSVTHQTKITIIHFPTSTIMKKSSPRSPWRMTSWSGSNCAGSSVSATVSRSHSSRLAKYSTQSTIIIDASTGRYKRLEEKVWMHYRSGTGKRWCIGAGRMLRAHSPGAALFCVKWRVMAAISKLWRKSWIRLRQSMRINVKNIPARFHPDPIWNDGALGFFEEVALATTTTTTTRVAIWDQFLI